MDAVARLTLELLFVRNIMTLFKADEIFYDLRTDKAWSSVISSGFYL